MILLFGIFSLVLLNCAKDRFLGLDFFTPFLDGAEVRFLCSIFCLPTTILGIVHGICTPMFLAQVAMLLDASFLGNLARKLGTRLLVSFLALEEILLIGLCGGSFLGTYVLNSLKKQEKQTHVHRSHNFLKKVDLILLQM
jgi:hypothetical protein